MQIKSGTLKHQIAEYIYRQGVAVTLGSALTAISAGTRTDTVRNALYRMRDDGVIHEMTPDHYALCPAMQAYFSDHDETKKPVGELVPSREAPTFKPWTGKYNVSAEAPRADAGPVHEMRCIHSGTSPVPFRGGL